MTDPIGSIKIDDNFRAIIESVPNGIILVNDAGLIVLCNSDTEKMFGYTKKELVGKSVELLVPIRFQHHHPHHRIEFKSHPKKRQMGAGRDLTALHKNGSEFPVEIGLNPIRILKENYVLALIVDISERKTTHEKLQKAYEQVQIKNEEMEQFVYTVSHDLKAPLVTSSSFISFLREDIEKQNYSEIPDSLNRLERAQKRMQELISDLLQLSRVGRMDLHIESIQTTQLLEEVIENNTTKLTERKIKIILADNFPTIAADKKRISQVFDNLVNNAIKYASDVENPKINIYFEETPDEIKICFKDNGPGIEPQYHKKIFELFQRLETDKEGTGVGLTIVSRIMQLHEGRVWIESSLGNGAAFWISFPKALQKRIAQ